MARRGERTLADRARAALRGVVLARGCSKRSPRKPARLDVLVHTHASENRDEVALVRSRTGLANVDYLAQTGLASERLCTAHCVWVDDREQALMAERGVKVLHCPGSNLQLGSGIAPVVDMRARGISVSLGADGAACNNRLDMFDEMRLAATLQAMSRGPGSLPARDVLHMATREGARALGLDARHRLDRARQARRLHHRRPRPPAPRARRRSLFDAGLRRPRHRRPHHRRRRRGAGARFRAGEAGRASGRRGSPYGRPLLRARAGL